MSTAVPKPRQLQRITALAHLDAEELRIEIENERAAIEAHLMECAVCRSEVAAWAELRRSMREVSTQTPSPSANLFAEIERRLDSRRVRDFGDVNVLARGRAMRSGRAPTSRCNSASDTRRRFNTSAPADVMR